jgi:3-phosphoshikimate 1-carboxyvinyltransferase
MKRIIDPLQKMGVAIQGEADRAPLRINSSTSLLRDIDYQLPVASAQVKSCLLLAALSANGTTTLREPGPSRDHTERMLNSMGIPVVRQPRQIQTSPDQLDAFITRITPPSPVSLTPLNLRLPGDISSAAFIMVAALITPGSEILIEDVGLNPTRTGLLDALHRMGADIQVIDRQNRQGEPVGELRVRACALKGIQVSGPLVVRMIDEFPAFAVAAANATGQTRVSGAQELRHKESDRITALCTELRMIGIDIEETPDGFEITGGANPSGGKVDPHGDHRLAMALAIAGLNAREPVIIKNAEIISESFPGFASTLSSIGAKLREQA